MYPQAHTKLNFLWALLLWVAYGTNASIVLGQESNLNALSKAAALLKESELPTLTGLKVKEVQKLPKLENTAWVRFEYQEGGYADTLRVEVLALYEDKTFAHFEYSNAQNGHFQGRQRTLDYWFNENEIRVSIEKSGSYSIQNDGSIILQPRLLSKSNKERIARDSSWKKSLLEPHDYYPVRERLQISRSGETDYDLKKSKFFPKVLGTTATKAQWAEYLVSP